MTTSDQKPIEKSAVVADINFAPDDGVWLFPLAQSLTYEQERTVLEIMRTFLATWHSHQTPLTARVGIVEQRLVVVKVRSAYSQVGGCAKDELFRTVKSAARRLQLAIVPEWEVIYRTEASWVIVSRAQLPAHVSAKQLTAETMILNREITTIAALRAGVFVRAADCWVSKYFT